MWPSPKAMLQSEFKGSLPIVYSRLAVSAEAKPQLERYIFMTYGGLRELSNYAIHQDRVVEIASDSNVSEKVVLDMKEILFAFPVTAMSDLEPHLNRIRDDVKKQRLTSAQKQDILPVERWLSLTIDDIVDFGRKQSLLNIDATVVTRTGHVLCGTIKHYNADAIYMQINGQIVTVYSHGLYRLDIKTMLAKPLKLQWNTMIESLKNQPFKFITYTDEGPIELSQIETTPNTVMGNAKIEERLLLERQRILFAYSSRATVNPEGWEDVDEQELQPIENLDFKSARNTRLKVITRAGHVLTGKIKNIDADAIYMQIKKQKVIVFRHGLISFQYTDPIS
jgi:sRNA-binding regulator protein Hfq